jgi:NADH-ubiquinone oxidoreductase chain 5
LSSFYYIGDDSPNMIYGMVGLMMVAVFGGRMMRWLIFCTPSVICLPFYLRFLTIFVCLFGG